MRLSIVMVRKNRTYANWCELQSLALQHFPRDQYEIIVMDDSTTPDTPRVFQQFSTQLPIRFVHFHGWRRTSEVYVGPRERKCLAFHINYGIRLARGELVLIETGEMVHLGETLYALTEPHDARRTMLYHAGMRDIQEDGLRAHNWQDHPAALWQQSEIWGEILVPPAVEDVEGFLCVSIRREYLLRLRGCDQAGMLGHDCEDEELVRRLRRMGCESVSSPQILVGHISHGRQDWTEDAEIFRLRLQNRRLKDQGYWDPSPHVKYYRPGTEKRPLRPNGDEWGMPYPWLECWGLDDTVGRLKEASCVSS